MPLYEFQCPACDRIFEELRHAGDETGAVCPKCGQQAPRIVSLSAFALKGSGFYANDYGNRRPGSFQKDGKGTIKGKTVAVPQLARDPGAPLTATADPAEETDDSRHSGQCDDPKEGA